MSTISGRIKDDADDDGMRRQAHMPIDDIKELQVCVALLYLLSVQVYCASLTVLLRYEY